jgi:hypothetical protein
VSYLNSPRKGRPRGMTICVWTNLGLIIWKTTSKNKQNRRRPQKEMEDDLKTKWKTTFKKKERRPQKKEMKTASKMIKIKDNLKTNKK